MVSNTKRTLKRKRSRNSPIKPHKGGAKTLKGTQHGGVETTRFNLKHVADYIKINEQIIKNIKEELKSKQIESKKQRGGEPTEKQSTGTYTKLGKRETSSGYTNLKRDKSIEGGTSPAQYELTSPGQVQAPVYDLASPGQVQAPVYDLASPGPEGKTLPPVGESSTNTEEQQGTYDTVDSSSEEEPSYVPMMTPPEANTSNYVNSSEFTSPQQKQIYETVEGPSESPSPEEPIYETVEGPSHKVIAANIPLSSLTIDKLNKLLRHYESANKALIVLKGLLYKSIRKTLPSIKTKKN